MPQLVPIDLAAEGVTYEVDFGYRNADSPAESNFGSQQPATASRRFKVTPWSKRHIFIRWLLGETGLNTDLPTDVLTRTPPQRHPLYLSLWADRVTSVKGHVQAPNRPAAGAGTRVYTLDEFDEEGNPLEVEHKLAEYESAIIDVEYAYYRYRPMGDGEAANIGITEEYERYTEMMDPTTSAEYLTLPGMSLCYTRPPATAGDGRPHLQAIPYGIGKILPLEEFTMIWHRVPYEVYQDGDYEGVAQTELHKRIFGDPWATPARKPYLGTVNAFPIFGRPAETLLFSRFAAVRRYGPIPTSWEWDLHFTFTFDPFRWNWKYYFETGAEVGPGSPVNRNGWYFVSRSGVYPTSVTDPDFGDYLDTPDDTSLYNTRNFAYLFRPGEIA